MIAGQVYAAFLRRRGGERMLLGEPDVELVFELMLPLPFASLLPFTLAAALSAAKLGP